MSLEDGTVRDVMTAPPHVLTTDATVTVAEAAELMRARDLGTVLVVEEDQLCGILTDRDIVVRVISERLNPERTRVGDVCSRELTTVAATDDVAHAVRLMRDKAIRRLPVQEAGEVVGVVTIGDIAIARDARSALADISTAPPNI